MITPIFHDRTNFDHANRAMVINNLTVLTEFSANQNRANQGFPVVVVVVTSGLCEGV